MTQPSPSIDVGAHYLVVDGGQLSLAVVALGGRMAWCYADNSGDEYLGGYIPVPLSFLETCQKGATQTVFSDDDRLEGLERLREHA